MVNRNARIILDIEAVAALKKAYEYIKKDSFENAQKVRTEILDSIKELIANPQKYPPDKYRKDQNRSFRAFEIHKYRITYHFSDVEIRIIRIRHTKMNPLNY